ncbi:MAG: hypothetical protein HY047_10030 [Acidobacteria bacterium]|nr:hypothetical protein [Acidobacteriota bacterium]
MRPGLLLSTALLAIVAVSCGSLQPVAVHTGDQCFRCRRTITEPKLAGEIIDGTFVSKFRTTGCMATYLADHPAESGTVFVTDYASGRMMRPDAAFFVPILLNRDTGERDYRAYQSRTDADAAAFEAHSVPVAWRAVLVAAKALPSA